MAESVVFIMPWTSLDNIYPDFRGTTASGPILLATILKQAGFKVRLIYEHIYGRPVDKRDLDADWLCLSLKTCMAPRGYEIAKMYREARPNGKIVAGGMHATFMTEEVLQHVDYIITGEAENAIVDLMKNPGKDRVIQGGIIEDLDSLPFPDMSLLEGQKINPSRIMITSRGCPRQCWFCAPAAMFGQFRAVSAERVLEEIDQFDYRKIVFLEDDFACDRKRVNAIVDGFLKRDRGIIWECQVTAGVDKDEELVKRMARSGCQFVYMGFEALTPESLKQVGKRQKIEDIVHSIRVFHENGISILAFLVLGWDTDTVESIRYTIDFCMKNRIERVHPGIVTPHPGTRLREKLVAEGRVFSNDWSLYDGRHVVFRPANMTPAQLQLSMLESWSALTSVGAIARDAISLPYETVMRKIGFMRRPPTMRRLGWRIMARECVQKWRKKDQEYIAGLPE
ncbi:MAG TPA: radical SAM protein [Candidatus Brocadiia bacterium]|nr:radical SAM protein [Candidatus Brocadiia bacterium]